MLRRLLVCLLLTIPLALTAQESPGPVLKALPLDPEEIPAEDPQHAPITPPVAPAPAPTVAKPLPAAAPELQTPPTADGIPTGDDAVRLQIFLDEALFGPGVIDGKPGLFTKLAVAAWNEVKGHAPDDWTPVMEAARKSVKSPFAIAVVPDIAKDWIDGTLPNDRPGQAKRKRMSYRSIGEFMAERYHTDDIYLTELNKPKKLSSLKAGDTLIVPNVQPFGVETLTGKKFEADPLLSPRHVVVDTKKNQVRIFEAAPAALIVSEVPAENGTEGAVKISRPNRGLIASFPITPGKPQFIKYGTWELKNCLELPYWRYDKSLLETGKRSSDALNIPPGPNSPVGVLWAGLSKPGIGMHGTADPETIGRARSAGCIRLANWDAIRLPNVIRPGATVEIR